MNGNVNQAFHRETIQECGVGEERIVRQHGGTAVYAGIRVEVRPLGRGKGTMVLWGAGANIPAKFATAVAKGVQDVISSGVLDGYELTDVLVSIEDGSYHEVDSSEGAFREAARSATAAALRQARPTVLEAVSICRATFPSEYTTAVEATIPSEEKQIEASKSQIGNSSLTATVPTYRASNLLEKILAVTNGQARCSIETAGFRPKAELPDAANNWPSVT